MSLYLVPVSWEIVRGFVPTWHRHHPKPPPGHVFRVGAASDGVLVGVAIIGRALSRELDDHALVTEATTLEVTRTVTDGHKNANSMLYGAAARGAFAMGYSRLITYTQAGESGASLRAAGWRIVAERAPRPGWDHPSRPREDHGVDHIARTLWEQTA